MHNWALNSKIPAYLQGLTNPPMIPETAGAVNDHLNHCFCITAGRMGKTKQRQLDLKVLGLATMKYIVPVLADIVHKRVTGLFPLACRNQACFRPVAQRHTSYTTFPALFDFSLQIGRLGTAAAEFEEWQWCKTRETLIYRSHGVHHDILCANFR